MFTLLFFNKLEARSTGYTHRNEEIITQVPPLLTPEQIERAKAKARTNKQFNARKYNYLLGGRVKCGVCGMTFVGMTANSKSQIRRYYTHSRHYRTEICIKNISVELIETAVIKALSELFSSTKNLKIAIENAIGVSKDRKEVLINKIVESEKRLKRLEQEKERLVSAVKKGLLDDADISKEMTKTRIDTIECRDQLKLFRDQLQTLLVDIPDDLHLRIQKFYRQLCNEEGNISEWEYKSQDKLFSWFFGIGKENGVFIMRNPPDGSICFCIKGALGSAMIGLMAKDSGNSFVVGFDKLEHTFNENEELVDFQRIIKDLDFNSNLGTC